MMTMNNENVIPLQLAAFCADCEFISSAKGEACPVCGSRSLFGLAKVLDRPNQLADYLEIATAHA